jgi:hypothetical protein
MVCPHQVEKRRVVAEGVTAARAKLSRIRDRICRVKTQEIRMCLIVLVFAFYSSICQMNLQCDGQYISMITEGLVPGRSDAAPACYLTPHSTIRVRIPSNARVRTSHRAPTPILCPSGPSHTCAHSQARVGPVTCPACGCEPRRCLLAAGARTVTHDGAPSTSRQLSASHRRH